MAAKAVVRDVARVQGKSYGLADKISKLIPKTPGISLAEAVEAEPQLKDLLNNPDNMDYEDANEIWEMAVRLEGITRGVVNMQGAYLSRRPKSLIIAQSIVMKRVIPSVSLIKTMWKQLAW